jgi:hypothetical protein
MTARARVLDAVRRAVTHATPHPGSQEAAGPEAARAATPAALESAGSLPHAGLAPESLVASFAAALVAAGGVLRGPLPRARLAEAVRAEVRAWGVEVGGRVVAEPSAAALLGSAAGVETAPPGDTPPHGFADVAVAIVRGAAGVAEGGAVAVTAADAPHRALLFLAERVILLLDAAHLVPDLAAGFRALPPGALAAHHLTWIAGPSKTADIEQTLVHGAHGPRAVTVVLGWHASRIPGSIV